MKPLGLYALSALAIIVAIGAVAWVFTDPAGRQTVLASAGLALAVQVVAFAVAKHLQARHLVLAWGLGSLLRFFALVLYAIVVARLWRAPLTPALLSFVAFLFVTTVFEPLFLRR